MKSGSIRRILVALDASPHSRRALEEAAALAERLEAELTGIYIQDSELLSLSALPAALETGLTSATRRVLDPEAMERALRLQAQQARLALEAIAESHRLRSTFLLSRGDVLAELLEAATRVDLVAMGLMGHMGMTGRRIGSTVRGITAGASCSVLLLTPTARTGPAVVAVYGESPDAEKSLRLAMDIASRRDAALIVVLYGTDEAMARMRDRASEVATEAGSQIVFESIGSGGFDALKTLVRQKAGGLLVVGCDSDLLAGRDDRLDELGCPVLLAR